jgi:hypothetical protein
MASINLTGVLRDPTGEFSNRNKIRFTHNTTTGQTPKGFSSVHTIVSDGSYDIDLEYGNVLIETHDALNRRWVSSGVITINSDTPATDLPSLLGITTPATDADLLVFQTLVADAKLAQTSAESAQAAAELAAQAYADMSGGTVISRIDENGNGNVMLKIPAYTLDAVNSKLGINLGTGLHPAFIKPDGTPRTHFEYALYTASNDGNGHPISAPFADPYTTISFDSAKSKCEAMGTGWHLASNAEWSAIVWLCIMNGWLGQHGNTNYGRYHGDTFETAIRQDAAQAGDASGTARTLTGSGPLSWRHNGAISGIADMVGNTWEWQDGFKQVNGQIYVAHRSGMAEDDWIAQAAWYNGDNKLAAVKTAAATGISVTAWSSQQLDANYIANPLLQALLIEPNSATADIVGKLYCNNTITGFPRRGGYWSYGSDAGLGALGLSNGRSDAGNVIGFRPAFFE